MLLHRKGDASSLDIPCSEGQVSHSSTTCEGNVGEECRYSCDAGYVESGQHVCHLDRAFRGGSCLAIRCQGGLYIVNSVDRTAACTSTVNCGPCEGTTDDACAYTCELGYRPQGFHICGADRNFTGGSCQANDCRHYRVPHSTCSDAATCQPDEETLCTGITGDECGFNCRTGYERRGQLMCTASGVFQGGVCVGVVPGCTDLGADNYDPSATVLDSGSCVYTSIESLAGRWWLRSVVSMQSHNVSALQDQCESSMLQYEPESAQDLVACGSVTLAEADGTQQVVHNVSLVYASIDPYACLIGRSIHGSLKASCSPDCDDVWPPMVLPATNFTHGGVIEHSFGSLPPGTYVLSVQTDADVESWSAVNISYDFNNTVNAVSILGDEAEVSEPIDIFSTSCSVCEQGQYKAQMSVASQCDMCQGGRYFDDQKYMTAPPIAAEVITAIDVGTGVITTQNPSAAGFAIGDTVQIADTGSGACSPLAAGAGPYIVTGVDSATLTVSNIDVALAGPQPSECSVERLSIQASQPLSCPGCAPGRFSPNGSHVCFNCSAGSADEDSNPATECTACTDGSYADPATPTICSSCEPGQADEDTDAMTACTACPSGTHSGTGEWICTPCAAGKSDIDGDAATECVDCETGQFSEVGSESCTNCVAGQADLDLDASTVCDICEGGRFSQDQSTSCTNCTSGRFAPPDSTMCTDCMPGRADRTEGLSARTLCSVCEAGTRSSHCSVADRACTLCEDCPRDTYAGREEKECHDCDAGQIDHDVSSRTPCVCNSGWAANQAIPTNASGAYVCTPCPVDTYRRGAGPGPPHRKKEDQQCISCSGTEMVGLECPVSGMAFPVAAAGYVVNVDEMDQYACIGSSQPNCARPKVCHPDRACQQIPPWGVLSGATVSQKFGSMESDYYRVGSADLSGPQLGDIPGCSTGYDSKKMCDKCVSEDSPEFSGTKYYRDTGTCEECPEGLTFQQMVFAFFVVVVASLVVVSAGAERMMGQTQIISQLATPFIILMTFFQTLSVVIDLDLKWPPILLDWIAFFSFLNFSLELGKPECSIDWDFELKLISTLASPLFIVVVAYTFKLVKSIAKYLIIVGRNLKQRYPAAEGRHKRLQEWLVNRTYSKDVVETYVETLYVASFTFGGLFFAKTLVMALDCSENVDGRRYLDAEPTLACEWSQDRDLPDPEKIPDGPFYIGGVVIPMLMLVCGEFANKLRRMGTGAKVPKYVIFPIPVELFPWKVLHENISKRRRLDGKFKQVYDKCLGVCWVFVLLAPVGVHFLYLYHSEHMVERCLDFKATRNATYTDDAACTEAGLTWDDRKYGRIYLISLAGWVLFLAFLSVYWIQLKRQGPAFEFLLDKMRGGWAVNAQAICCKFEILEHF